MLRPTVCAPLIACVPADVQSAEMPCTAPLREGTEKAGHFAAALLCGNVLSGLASLRDKLNCKPQTMASREGRALRRVSDFVLALELAGVTSKASLACKWHENGMCFSSPHIFNDVNANFQTMSASIVRVRCDQTFGSSP